MADTASPFRLTAPAHQAFDTTPGVQMVLRGMNPENMGMMYGMLVGQRADAAAGQAGYNTVLGAVNRQQQALAQQKLEQDRREHEGKMALGLVQHGNLGVAPALNAMDLRGLRGFMSPEQAAVGALDADQQTRLLNLGRAYESAGAGAYSAAQAGAIMDPGQSLPPGAAGLLGASRTTGTPIPITTASIRAAASGSTGSGGRPRYQTRLDEFGNVTITATTDDPQAAVAAGTDMRGTVERDRDARTRAAGGNLGANGLRMPTTPPPAQTTPPNTPAPAAGPRTIESTSPIPTPAPRNVPAQLSGPLTPGGDPARQGTTVTARGASGANTTGLSNLTAAQRAAVRRIERDNGSVTGYIRTGDRMFAVTPKGRVEIVTE